MSRLRRERFVDDDAAHIQFVDVPPPAPKPPDPDEAEPTDADKLAKYGLSLVGGEGPVRYDKDASGHEHKGKGPGGGQFVSQGGGDGSSAEKMPIKPTKSKAKVKHKGDTAKAIQDVFEDEISDEDLASLVGAPDDAEVTVERSNKGNIILTVDHKDYDATRIIRRSVDGSLVIKNDEFFVKDYAQGKGLGVDVFTRQVEQARAMGVSRIECHAAKFNPQNKDKPHNGYYTWPRFGYDSSIDDLEEENQHVAFKIRKLFPDADSILDVMSTKAGRDWWTANGVDLHHCSFDLSPGSRSLKILDAYQSERASRPEKN